jgi:DMSO/TMAO reductase YedYZ heme-binding membrane subunit
MVNDKFVDEIKTLLVGTCVLLIILAFFFIIGHFLSHLMKDLAPVISSVTLPPPFKQIVQGFITISSSLIMFILLPFLVIGLVYQTIKSFGKFGRAVSKRL